MKRRSNAPRAAVKPALISAAAAIVDCRIEHACIPNTATPSAKMGGRVNFGNALATMPLAPSVATVFQTTQRTPASYGAKNSERDEQYDHKSDAKDKIHNTLQYSTRTAQSEVVRENGMLT